MSTGRRPHNNIYDPDQPVTVERLTTGIPGLDDMCEGGIIHPSITLIGGEPGTGKTTFAVQSLFHGADIGEKGLYITAISEPQWVVQRFLSAYNFFQESHIESGLITFLDIGTKVHEDPASTIHIITQAIEAYGPKRVVIDPITPIRELLEDTGGARLFMHELFAYLKTYGCMTLITSELTYSAITTSLEAYMVDNVIMLSYPEEEQVRRKFLEVLKMRGTKHTTGRQLMDLSGDGLRVQVGLR